MTALALTDADLYLRGAETVVASWAAIARGSRDAAVMRLPGVAAAVFPEQPERTVYNNALLARGLAARERREAVAAMEAAYAAGGVERFAAWAHENDDALCAELEARGYTIDTTTRAMGMALGDLQAPRSEIELAPAGWADYLRHLGLDDVPPGLLRRVDPDAFEVRVARAGGEIVAAAIAFDHDGDCGIYNVSTLAHARRRGIGTALTALHLHDARARGCATASIQATEIAEGIYAAAGFRDLGRFLEYVPDGA